MNYINLCPHAIHICGEDGNILRTIEPSGTVARCEEVTEPVINWRDDMDINMIAREYGEVTGLPKEAETDDVLYIVSNMVRQALPDRLDLASPGDTVRDPNGRIIGCKNLIVNEA